MCWNGGRRRRERGCASLQSGAVTEHQRPHSWEPARRCCDSHHRRRAAESEPNLSLLIKLTSGRSGAFCLDEGFFCLFFCFLRVRVFGLEVCAGSRVNKPLMQRSFAFNSTFTAVGRRLKALCHQEPSQTPHPPFNPPQLPLIQITQNNRDLMQNTASELQDEELSARFEVPEWRR